MDFQSLPRKDLQALCKKNGIPANITNVAMLQKLSALEVVIGLEGILGVSPSQKQKTPAKETRTQMKTDAPEITQSISLPRRVTRRTATDQEENSNAVHAVSSRKKSVETHKQDNIADVSALKGVSTRKGDPRTAKNTRNEVETVDINSTARRVSRRIVDAGNQTPSVIVKRTQVVSANPKKAVETERLDEKVSVKRGCSTRRLTTKSKGIRKQSYEKTEEDGVKEMEFEAVKLDYEEHLESVSDVQKVGLIVTAQNENCLGKDDAISEETSDGKIMEEVEVAEEKNEVETVDVPSNIRRSSRRIAGNETPSGIVKRNPAVSSKPKKAVETERLEGEVSVKGRCSTRRLTTKSKDIRKHSYEKIEEDEVKKMEIEAVKIDCEEELESMSKVLKEELDETAEKEDCLGKDIAMKEETFDGKMVEEDEVVEERKDGMDISAGNEDELMKGFINTSTQNENEIVEREAAKERMEVLDACVDEQGIKEKSKISFQFESEHLNLEVEEIEMDIEEPYEKKIMEECEMQNASLVEESYVFVQIESANGTEVDTEEESYVFVQIESANGTEVDTEDGIKEKNDSEVKLDKSNTSVQVESESLHDTEDDTTELGIEEICYDTRMEVDDEEIEEVFKEQENVLVGHEDHSNSFVQIDSEVKFTEREAVEATKVQGAVESNEEQEPSEATKEQGAVAASAEREKESLNEAQERVPVVNEVDMFVKNVNEDDDSEVNEDESKVSVDKEETDVLETIKEADKSELGIVFEEILEEVTEKQEDASTENKDETNVAFEIEGSCENKEVTGNDLSEVSADDDIENAEEKTIERSAASGKETMETVVCKIDEIVEKLTDTANICTNSTALESIKAEESLTLGESIRIFEASIEKYEAEMELCSDEEEWDKDICVYEDKREILVEQRAAFESQVRTTSASKKKETDKENTSKGLKEMSLRKLRRELKMHTAKKEDDVQVDTHRVPLQALHENI